MLNLRFVVLCAVAAFFAGVAPAAAQGAVINNAKAQCLVGERADGYIGVVTGKTVDQNVLRQVNRINQQRRAEYEKIAARNGTTTEAAAVTVAQQLINRARPGHCVQNASGAWVQR
ncbi:MAG: YdbL family protein [Pseudomonadota bacterium]